MDEKRISPSILMLPWLAHGHVSPFLELAKKLSQRNFQIYFCSTPIIMQSIRETLADEFIPSMKLLDLHLPSSPELPPHSHTTKGLPRSLIPSLVTALDQANGELRFSAIIREYQPDLLIYDSFQPWAPIAAREENVKGSVLFLITSASLSMGSFNVETHTPDVRAYLEESVNGVRNEDRHRKCFNSSSEIIIQKTSREIEGKYLNELSGLAKKKVLPTGLLVQSFIKQGSEDEKIMKWMDEKDPGSVVFVSFGTENYLSVQETEEMANGLELSQVNFIWVLKFDRDNKYKYSTLNDALPNGFLQRIKDSKRGIVIDGWAPQSRILGHRSIGGFFSHCGWSSVTEAIHLGVPIIAMPLQLDQYDNARNAAEMGMAMEVHREEGEFIRRENVARVIQEVVIHQGEAFRRQAKELSKRVRETDEEEVGQLVEELRRLCRQ